MLFKEKTKQKNQLKSTFEEEEGSSSCLYFPTMFVFKKVVSKYCRRRGFGLAWVGVVS